MRQRCQSDFGFNPFIILSGDFFTNDTTCTAAGVADGEQDWFTPPNRTFSVGNRNGTKFGVAIAQFKHSGISNYTDPNHGQTFDTGLTGTVETGGSLMTLWEGFTDYEEEAAMWRASNVAPDGTALTYSQTGYDYPNQRINILRKHSHAPFPQTLRLETEGCDYFGAAAGGNGKTNFYRNGNIGIAATSDATGGGFQIGWMQPGEWLEWEQLPLNGTQHLQIRLANPNANMKAHLVIDGITQPDVTLPNTGNWSVWTTFDMGAIGTYTQGYHNIRVVFNTGNVNVNWIQLTH